MMSKIQRLKQALEYGDVLTGPEITKFFELKNPHEAVSRLRKQGMCIYTNENGYRLGTPTKSMIARLYNIYGGEIFERRA